MTLDRLPREGVAPTRFPSLWTCVRGRSAWSVTWSCSLVRSSADALEPRRMRPELETGAASVPKGFKSVRGSLSAIPPRKSRRTHSGHRGAGNQTQDARHRALIGIANAAWITAGTPSRLGHGVRGPARCVSSSQLAWARGQAMEGEGLQMATDRTDLCSIDELASAERHARALMASGVTEPHERTHLVAICDRIEDAVRRKREQEPIPIRRDRPETRCIPGHPVPSRPTWPGDSKG